MFFIKWNAIAFLKKMSNNKIQVNVHLGHYWNFLKWWRHWKSRKRNFSVLVMSYGLWHHYDIKETSMSFQQLHHVITQQFKPPNKSFNLNREILLGGGSFYSRPNGPFRTGLRGFLQEMVINILIFFIWPMIKLNAFKLKLSW